MARISLKEAYDNRDVIAQLVSLRDDVDELLNILKDIDPSGDLTNVVTKTGDQTIDGVKTFIGKIVADCDIIQNGSAYETHAEQIYSHDDYIVMRDGQLNGLAAGTYSGLHVKRYNGIDDVRMVVDNTGIMRVGKVGDEQPLMTRLENNQMGNGDMLRWDGTEHRAVTSPLDSVPTQGSTNVVTSDGIRAAIDEAVASGIANKLSVLFGGKKIQSGYDTSGTGSVSFQTSFSSPPIVIVTVNSGATLIWSTNVSNVTVNGFSYLARYSSDGNTWTDYNKDVYWIAIGD